MNYYSQKLSGEKLRECYSIAPSRIKQYLDAEINYLVSHIRHQDSVLDLGCGYGRVTSHIAKIAKRVTGIDTSIKSIELACKSYNEDFKCDYLEMNAVNMNFPDELFDLVFCVQNGICAFGVDKPTLIQEALRVTKVGGKIIFSSYSKNIWDERLKWFELQAAGKLLGEIDSVKTGNGTIVCKDGFKSDSLTENELRVLGKKPGIEPVISEIDNSSIMCLLIKS